MTEVERDRYAGTEEKTDSSASLSFSSIKDAFYIIDLAAEIFSCVSSSINLKFTDKYTD